MKRSKTKRKHKRVYSNQKHFLLNRNKYLIHYIILYTQCLFQFCNPYTLQCITNKQNYVRLINVLKLQSILKGYAKQQVYFQNDVF